MSILTKGSLRWTITWFVHTTLQNLIWESSKPERITSWHAKEHSLRSCFGSAGCSEIRFVVWACRFFFASKFLSGLFDQTKTKKVVDCDTAAASLTIQTEKSNSHV